MVLRSIEYQGFRNLTDNQLEFSDTFNILVGDNGAGKTNLLEAIFYVAMGSSFRVRDERNLIRLNDHALRLSARSETKSAQIFFNGEKRLMLQGHPVKNLNEFIGWLMVTILSLEDIWIIRGAPVKRRSFIDWLITKLHPLYLLTLNDYRRVLRQRNRLLQQARHENQPDFLDAYDEQLIQLGNELYEARRRYLPQLCQQTVRAADYLGLPGLQISYHCTCPGMRMTVEQLRRLRSDEIKLAETTIGPHRDDLRFFLADRPLHAFASEGEERTVAVALKMAEIEMLKSQIHASPIILMDEATAEFDAHRVALLFALLKGQIFYSSTRRPDFLPEGQCREFRVTGGKIEISGTN